MHGSFSIGMAIFLGVYVLAAWAGFTWARYRINRRARQVAEALEQVGIRVVAQRPTKSIFKSAEIDITRDGVASKITVRQWGRDSQVITLVGGGPAMPAVWIRRERGLDRFGKALGLEREVQLGVKEIDDAAWIASSAKDEVVREALAGEETQRLVREILGFGYSVTLSRDGVSLSTVSYVLAPMNVNVVPTLLDRLEKLIASLPRMDPSLAGSPRSPVSSFAIIVPASLSIFVPMVLLVPAFRGLIHVPVGSGPLVFSLLSGVGVWIVVIYLISRKLQRRPLAMIEIFVVALAMLASLPFLTAFGLFYLNATLDHGAATQHHTHVVSFYRHNLRTVYVGPWDATHVQQKVVLSDAIPAVTIGDPLEIDSRPGAFGWEWVSRMRPGE